MWWGPRNSVRIREIPNESKRADPRKSGSRLSRILSCKLRLRSGDRGSRVLLSSLQRPKVTLADVSCVQELARQLLLPHLRSKCINKVGGAWNHRSEVPATTTTTSSSSSSSSSCDTTCSEHERRTERVEVLRRKREKDVAKFSGHTDSDAYVVGGTRYSVVARRRVGDDKSWVTTL
uniref:Uncharacterized protein n=1 Tax=Vespula pensylvanica TaxID=30213 RepID=A0A834P5W1_VESPE|nr:hypothetical protein H0235_006053 [Vespula pensylvanica]